VILTIQLKIYSIDIICFLPVINKQVIGREVVKVGYTLVVNILMSASTAWAIST
jgi:hypothetical protein